MSKKLKKILCVEDEEDILEIILMALEGAGSYQVEGCPNGLVALEKIPKFKPDLVLLDVMMPGMDGVATFEEIKKLDLGKDLPVVFMTAKVQSHEVKNYLEQGALGVISKPFDPISLPEQLLDLWNKAS